MRLISSGAPRRTAASDYVASTCALSSGAHVPGTTRGYRCCPRLPTQSTFIPYVLSESDVKRLLGLCTTLSRPTFRAPLFRMLLLVLYCTGIRFGEALQLRNGDVDVQAGVLFERMFKGRARCGCLSTAHWLEKWRSIFLERQSFAGELTGPDERFSSELRVRRCPSAAPGIRYRSSSRKRA